MKEPGLVPLQSRVVSRGAGLPARAVSRAVSRTVRRAPRVATADTLPAGEGSRVLAETRDGVTTLARSALGHPQRSLIEAHESVHRAQFALGAAGAPVADLPELESEATAGARALVAGRAFSPGLAAPAGLRLFAELPPLERLRVGQRLAVYGDTRNPVVVVRRDWLLANGVAPGQMEVRGDGAERRVVRAALRELRRIYGNADQWESIARRTGEAKLWVRPQSWESAEVELIPEASTFTALGVDPDAQAGGDGEPLFAGDTTSAEVQRALFDTGGGAVLELEARVEDLERAYANGTRAGQWTSPGKAPWRATGPDAYVNTLEGGAAHVVGYLAEVRRRVEQIGGGDFDPVPTQVSVRAIQGFLHRRLNRVSPYFTQQANLDILPKGGSSAWERTCNVTSLAMAMGGLGISPADWKGGSGLPGVERLQQIHEELEQQSLERSVLSLRLPDFLQLVVIGMSLGDALGESSTGVVPGGFGPALDAARAEAAALVSSNAEFFRTVASGFGVERVELSIFKIESTGLNRLRAAEAFDRRLREEYRKTLQIETDRRATPRRMGGRKLGRVERRRVAAGISAFPNVLRRQLADELLRSRGVELIDGKLVREGKPIPKKERRQLQREAAAAGEQRLRTELAPDLWEEPKTVSTEAFRLQVVEKVVPHLDRGHQVMILRRGHYIRLEDVLDTGLRIDDPASIGAQSPGRDAVLSWEEANDLAFFRAYHVFR